MRKNLSNSRGFTLAELAASLGIFALAATILTPAFSGVSANTATLPVNEGSAAAVSPFTPPVDSILIDVRDAATGNLVKQAVVNDPTATSTTISGLDANKDYTFEVAKQNQAGKSPAAVAQVVYSKVGERQDPRTRIIQVDDTSRPIYEQVPVYGDGTPIMGKDTSRPTAWAQKVTGYEKKTISVPASRQKTVTQVWESVTKSRQVRVAPFERTVTKSRQVRVAPFTRTVSCGTESYTYSSTCPRTRNYACGTESYTYSCTKSRTESYVCGSRSYSYACGTTTSCSGSGKNRRCTTSTRYCTGSEPRYCSRTVDYSSTCTGSRTKYCSVTENEPCTKTGTRTKYCDEAAYNYRTENYTETEDVFNYKTETYTEMVNTGRTSTSYGSLVEGNCSTSGIYTGHHTAVYYYCEDGFSINKTVDDLSSPRYGDDKSKPIAWADKVVGYKQDRHIGWANGAHLGYEKKDAIDNYTVTVDVMKGITAAKAVKALPGQLLLDAATVTTVNNRWKEATIAASGSNKAVGSKVRFTKGQLVTINGKQYVAVASAATR